MVEQRYFLDSSPDFEKKIRKLKRQDPILVKRLTQQVAKILREPILGKPLRNVLRNCRRVQVGSFVLIYEVTESAVRLLDFDHHD
ncbi:MAG: type II toxin-antitoxin system RelE/ParE family toxin [Patescibacteria group bacterium]